MVKNRQKSQLLVGVPNNRPISAKKRKKYAKIFVKKSVDMGLISEKICMGGWVYFQYKSVDIGYISLSVDLGFKIIHLK